MNYQIWNPLNLYSARKKYRSPGDPSVAGVWRRDGHMGWSPLLVGSALTLDGLVSELNWMAGYPTGARKGNTSLAFWQHYLIVGIWKTTALSPGLPSWPPQEQLYSTEVSSWVRHYFLPRLIRICLTKEEKQKAKEKGKDIQLNVEFQRIARGDKKAFSSEQWKEIQESNRMRKTRDRFKETGDTKGTFLAKIGSIKDKNCKDLIEAEEIKRRWQEYTK